LVTLVLVVVLVYGPGLLGRIYVNSALLAWNRKVLPSCSCFDPDEWPLSSWSIILPELKAAVRWGNTPSAHRMLGYYEMSLGHTEEAFQAWKRANLPTDVLMMWGDLAKEHGRWDAAVTWYERAAALSPNDSVPWYEAARVHEQQQAWEQALVAYQEAAKRDMWGALSIRSGDVYSRMAMIYYSRLDPPRFDEALAASEAAIQRDDFFAPWSEGHAHYLRGRILWQENQPEAALEEFQKAVRAYDDHVEAHYWLGMAYYVLRRDTTRAETEMRIALALRPDNKWPYIYLGKVYSETNRIEDAIESYRRALAIDPHDTAVQERLAELMEKE
jgi:tetratricopeptide (TPR) repeat protein